MRTVEPAPIALFVFKRPNHLRRMLDSLSSCHLSENSDLTIFFDGPKNRVQEADVRLISRLSLGARHGVYGIWSSKSARGDLVRKTISPFAKGFRQDVRQ